MPPTVPAPVEDTPKPKRKQVKQAVRFFPPISGAHILNSKLNAQCTNCAAACKRCDDERPCGRCTKYGIGESCIDGKRKERQKGIKRGPYKRRAKEANAADTSTEQVDSPPPAPGTFRTASASLSQLTIFTTIASTSEAEAQPVLPPPEGYPPYMIPPGYYPPPPPGDPNAPPPVDGAAHPPYYHFPPMPYPPYGYPPPPGSSPPTLIAPQTVAPAATSVQPKEDEQSAALSPQSDAASPEPPRKKARLDKAREPEVLERDELREEPEEEEQNGDS